jgi:hypothetical protein
MEPIWVAQKVAFRVVDAEGGADIKLNNVGFPDILRRNPSGSEHVRHT